MAIPCRCRGDSCPPGMTSLRPDTLQPVTVAMRHGKDHIDHSKMSRMSIPLPYGMRHELHPRPSLTPMARADCHIPRCPGTGRNCPGPAPAPGRGGFGVIALLIGNKRHQPQPRRPSALRHPAARQAPRWPAARQPVDVCPCVAISLWLQGYLDESQGVLCMVHREAWD